MNRDLHHTMTAQYAAPKVSGNGVVRWDGGVKCVLPSVKLCGAAAQDGTPTPDAPVMPVCNDGVFQAHGDTILGTTKLNTLDFGWRKNTDNEFGIHIVKADNADRRLGAKQFQHQIAADESGGAGHKNRFVL